MNAFSQKNPVVIVVVVLIAVVAGWMLWPNFFGGGQANLPANAPAAGGRVPGPMGGTVPGLPSKTGKMPGR